MADRNKYNLYAIWHSDVIQERGFRKIIWDYEEKSISN